MAVRWYLAYALSYRDIEELLLERGLRIDHATIKVVSQILKLLNFFMDVFVLGATRQLKNKIAHNSSGEPIFLWP